MLPKAQCQKNIRNNNNHKNKKLNNIKNIDILDNLKKHNLDTLQLVPKQLFLKENNNGYKVDKQYRSRNDTT